MTRFLNGPAKGQVLMLRRAPRFLRATELRGSWDALDQVADNPRAAEKLYAYEQTGQTGTMHVRASGGAGGFCPMADYRLVEPQPTDQEMRSNERWQRWCREQAKATA